MSTPVTLETLHDELVAIRALINALAVKALAPAASRPSSSPSKPAEGEINLPQPTFLVDDPGAVEVHFGKNKDVALSQLSESSLSWYAAKWEPREKNTGGLWPNDEGLLNAARQLWHMRQNTLKGGQVVHEPATDQGQMPAPRSVAQQKPDDEEVPF